MSHFTTLATRITDQDALVAALSDVGYPHVEVHREPRALIGFEGDQRAQRAHVIVRRKHVGSVSNDIGFERQSDGHFRAWISEFDRHDHDDVWLGNVVARHAYHATQKTMAAQGFQLAQEQQDRDGTVRLILRRMT